MTNREDRLAAKQAINDPWTVEDYDFEDGSKAYEVLSVNSYFRVARISDDDNPCAKRDAEHIVALHNASLK